MQSDLQNYNSTARRKLCDITRNLFSDSSQLAPKYTSLRLRMFQFALWGRLLRMTILVVLLNRQ